MIFKQKLTKIGNSVGVIIPQQLLKALGIGFGTEMYLELLQDKIIMKEDAESSASPEFLKIAEKVGKKYSAAFKELASK